MNIRNATLDDLPEIVSIYNATIPGRMVTADTEPVSVESRIAWFESHDPEVRPLWVAEENGSISGWVSFKSFYGRPAYQGTAEIAIYLAAKAQGKGLGYYLLQKSIEACPDLKIHTLLGFIFGHNLPSIRLFQKSGFTQWGFLPEVAILDGVPRDLAILGRKV